MDNKSNVHVGLGKVSLKDDLLRENDGAFVNTLLLAKLAGLKKSSKKSLLNVFQHGIGHLKMEMVIDDRCKVWEDKDQPCVHLASAFIVYYAPQAEIVKPKSLLAGSLPGMLVMFQNAHSRFCASNRGFIFLEGLQLWGSRMHEYEEFERAYVVGGGKSISGWPLSLGWC